MTETEARRVPNQGTRQGTRTGYTRPRPRLGLGLGLVRGYAEYGRMGPPAMEGGAHGPPASAFGLRPSAID